MLRHAGLPEPMLKWWHAVYRDLERVIRIGHTYGEPFRPYNGIGQGDPFSLLPAILLVQFQVAMVRGTKPDVALGAVIDDRNFRKKILSTDLLIKTDKKDKTTSKKGAFVYRFDTEKYNELRKQGYHLDLNV